MNKAKVPNVYTLSNARSNLFNIAKNVSNSDQSVQFTFHPKGQTKNSNVYLINQKQYEILKKAVNDELIQKGIAYIIRESKKMKPTSKENLKHDLGL